MPDYEMLNQVQHDGIQNKRHPELDSGSLLLKMRKSYIYIISNKNRTVLYIGVTNNLIKRITEHKNRIGSEFSKKYNLEYLLYFEEFTDITQAISREKQLKNWRKKWKWDLIRTLNPNLKDLISEL